MNALIRFFFVILFLSGIISCGGNNKGSEAGSNPEKKQEDNLATIKIAGLPLKVEIVQDEDERMRGLMYREELPEDQGMLFVFATERILSFWMRNTFIPLDIAFINSGGKIVDIQYMEPLDESKQYISAAPGLYALEVNAGWFEKNKIKVGSQVLF